MESVFVWTTLALFALATLALVTYGLHLYVLLFLHARRARSRSAEQARVIEDYASSAEDWPVVTTQLPIYNEGEVARRIIDSAARLDYPAGRHEIQVLDDSDDSTCRIVDEAAKDWRERGVDVQVIRREDRKAFKAGALAFGLSRARGEYVAIFDADFVPGTDFLRRAVPLIEEDERLACVQGRWGHLNRNQSWLTEAQALGIDGHFAIEQGARAWNGLMMNFNGTAGIWRRAAIEDPQVGGWSGDTLTEDLDLSYRAQLCGWRIDYSFDLACPAELPGTVEAFKSQQRRWATGSTQVAVKLLPRIWRAPLGLAKKVEATLHLTHYSVAIWMLLLALVARPMAIVYADGLLSAHWMWMVWSCIVVAAFAPSLVYVYARHVVGGGWHGFRTIPSMMILGCGMCVNNALAVVRGLRLQGGEFVRTPKSGSIGSNVRSSSYRVVQTKMWAFELLLGVYSLVSFVFYFTHFIRVFSVFLLLYAIGFVLIGCLSIPRGRGRAEEAEKVFAGLEQPQPE